MSKPIYDHIKIEEKWMKEWEEQGLFQNSERVDKGAKGQRGKDETDNQAQPKDFGELSRIADEPLAQTSQVTNQNKMYLLFAFAYPSGSGLHVGHVESKTALDIMARYYRMNGKQVFFPVGWDAFGLPAENYAIKTGIPPAVTTKNAIDTFRGQIKRLGISYDWANEIATSHPEYYKWTQWIFLQLYKKGLAYQATAPVNWCPTDQTVLANEQVVNGKCERCGSDVIQKEMKQWFFKITQYQDELISGLDMVDWPNATKQQQLNWIGRSEGINITFQVADSEETIDCFTTAPTNWGASFLALAPEHPIIKKITTPKQKEAVQKYIEEVKKKSELDRTINKDKTGVFTGAYVINHVNGEKIPVWISDFVLAHVGTGALQGCPGHDMRDFEFAKKFRIPIPRVVVGPDGDTSPIERPEQVIDKTMPGNMINSDFIDGLSYKEGLQKTMDYFEEKGWGKRIATYKLRDWLISRQRYWGAPIPVVYDPEGNAHQVKEEHLPWTLPTDVEFKPTGESPLTHSKEFIQRTERLYGKGWRPEFDTMDTFVDSSWYFLRYPSARWNGWEHVKDPSTAGKQTASQRSQDDKDDVNSLSSLSRKPDQGIGTPFDLELTKEWLPVDLYMIGPEHIVLHLLYARFFTKFLRDEGYLSSKTVGQEDSLTGKQSYSHTVAPSSWFVDEPFMKMRHQGMIMGPDGKKMSKSKGNVINPDEIIEKFGADTLRVYEMFMGPIEADKPWNTNSVVGIYRFLNRVWELVTESVNKNNSANSLQRGNVATLQRKLHQTIKKVTRDIPEMKFNTAIASMMELVNIWEENSKIKEKVGQRHAFALPIDDVKSFIKILCPFAPFMAEELWQQVGQHDGKTEDQESIHLSSWPTYREDLLVEEQVAIVVQVNGKVRATIEIESEKATHKEFVVSLAKEHSKVSQWLDGHSIKKEIFVPGKIVNFVV